MPRSGLPVVCRPGPGLVSLAESYAEEPIPGFRLTVQSSWCSECYMLQCPVHQPPASAGRLPSKQFRAPDWVPFIGVTWRF